MYFVIEEDIVVDGKYLCHHCDCVKFDRLDKLERIVLKAGRPVKVTVFTDLESASDYAQRWL